MIHKVYFADACNVLKQHIDDESIATVIAGPPFFVRCQTGVTGELGLLSEADFFNELKTIFRKCKRKLVPGGKFLVQAGQIYLPKDMRTNHKVMNLCFDFYKLLSGVGLEFDGAIHYYNKHLSQRRVYLGSYPYPCSIPVPNQVEEILVFSKLGKRDVTDEIKLSSVVSKEEFKEFSKPVWEFNERVDKAAFPLGLAKRLIKFYSFKGDVILDPFLGHGTTLIASMELDRSCIGIEINSSFETDIRKKLGSKADEVNFVY